MTATVLYWIIPSRFDTPTWPLVATEALGDPDTDGPWAIGYFTGRLSSGTAADKQVAAFIEYVFNKQRHVQIHVVIQEVEPRVKNRIGILVTIARRGGA